MTARDLLQDFEQLGVRLWCDGDALKFEAPKGVMTSDRINILKQHKPDLLAYLSAGLALSIEPLEHANDAPPTPWERLKQRAMAAYEYELRQSVGNLLKNGYSDINAMVNRKDWRTSIQKVMRLSYEQLERLECELIQDGSLAYECARTCLKRGNGQPMSRADRDNRSFMLADDKGRTFINWLNS